MKRHRNSAFLLVLAAFAWLARAPAEATTYVMVEDPDLADQAPLIVEVTVEAVASASLEDRVATDYQMSVDRVLKGFLPGSSIIVRVAGGRAADGRELILHGAPRFREGGRALLFLRPRSDGTFGILHFLLGAFHVAPGPDGDLALRNLAGSQQVTQDGRLVAATPTARSLDAFRRWLEDRGAGVERAVDYLVDLPQDELSSIAEAYTLIDVASLPVRWTQFDSGGRVTFRLHEDGQPGLADKGVSAFKGALRAWSDAPGTPVELVYGGETGRTGGLTNNDNTNAILFDDPNDNETFDAPFSCATGGIVAAGGPWANPLARITWKGEGFRQASEGDIVTNKGISCWISRNARAPEVFTHELGHTLGLGHSCGDDEAGPCNTTKKNQAVMRATAHGDNRGADVREDDLDGLCFLYSPSGICEIGGGGGGGGGGTPPAAPSGLTAQALSATQAQLTWQDNASDETQFQVERSTGGTFSRIATLGANVTSYLDSGLFGNTAYLYRVRARNDDGSSAWSNTATVNTPSAEPPPARPDDLTAETQSATRVRLTWRDNANNETGYEVQVSTGTTFVSAATVGAGLTSANVNGLTQYTPYTFRVRALGNGGTSAFSNEAAALTHPADDSTPTAPSGLVAVPQSPTEVLLSWIDNADNELGYEVETAGAEGGTGGGAIEVLPGKNVSGITLSGLQAGIGYTFRVRAQGVNDLSAAAEATATITAAGSTCLAGAETGCQLGSRFKVEVQWRNQRNGEQGKGGAEALTDRSSTFWFFNAANTELIVKTLDGSANNGNYWVFYGALTDVEYWLTVSDTVSGQIASYHNQPFNICGGADTKAIANASSAVSWQEPSSTPLSVETASDQTASDGTACGGVAGDLCLLGNRFRVEVEWTKLSGQQGVGTAIPDSDRTGYFWFFNADNTELVVKMLDGRSNNGKFWFFYGALSNVHYEITVTDTQTGAAQTYVNGQGNLCGRADINAF
jgi:Fibronectin type III domain/Metallo-peptidase family M12